MLDFSAKPEERNNDLIPKDTLVWMVINIRGVKTSATTGTRYLDGEFTIDEGQPYAKRKIWHNIMDPTSFGNSEGARNMGQMQIRRILEAAFGANPDNPESYKCISDFSQLTGKRVPVRIGFEKSKDERYEDKNTIEFLSPYSTVKSVTKAYDALVHGGEHSLKSEGSGNTGNNPPSSSGFGSPPSSHQPQNNTGFGNPPAGGPPANQPPPQSQSWLNQNGGNPTQNTGGESDIPFPPAGQNQQ